MRKTGFIQLEKNIAHRLRADVLLEGSGIWRRNRRCNLSLTGFTLLEIMVSTVILALLASGIFSVLVSSRYLVARSKTRVAAVEIARAEIERMRSLVDADTFYTSGLFKATGAWRAWNTTSYPSYRVRYRVDKGAGNAAYRKVTVQVAWNDTTI